MEWIKSSESLPEIDHNDMWAATSGKTKDVLTFSKVWGRRNGRYFHVMGMWTVDGVHSSDGIEVDFWMDIQDPKY